MHVSRPSADTLVLTRTRFSALIRLLIWLAIVAGFYAVLLGDERVHARGLLLLVPLFLLPYLFDIARVLLRGESYVFDARARELRAVDHAPVAFAQIQRMELRTVNGGCEELMLSACLHDGRRICLLTDGASTRTVKLARELAQLVGVELTQR